MGEQKLRSKCVFCVCCVQKVSSEVRPVWFVFAGMGTQWPHMGRDLMTLDCFRESIMRLDTVLRPYGIQLCDLLMDSKEDTFNDTVNSFVGIAGIQVLCLCFCGQHGPCIFHLSFHNRAAFQFYLSLIISFFNLDIGGYLSFSDPSKMVLVLSFE